MQKQESPGSRAASAAGMPGGLLTRQQRRLLRTALAGRLLAVCYGEGVDSTALLVALKLADLRPDIITFADLVAEKPQTMAHLDRMQSILVQWGWPPITICRKRTLPGTGYDDLYGNCIANETLPSLAFGMRSCSLGLAFETVFLAATRDGPATALSKKLAGVGPFLCAEPACSCNEKVASIVRSWICLSTHGSSR